MNKLCAGDVRLLNYDEIEKDQDYDYFISCKDGKLWIKFSEVNEDLEEIIFEGTLEEMAEYIKGQE
jgi:hypothetical protein